MLFIGPHLSTSNIIKELQLYNVNAFQIMLSENDPTWNKKELYNYTKLNNIKMVTHTQYNVVFTYPMYGGMKNKKMISIFKDFLTGLNSAGENYLGTVLHAGSIPKGFTKKMAMQNIIGGIKIFHNIRKKTMVKHPNVKYAKLLLETLPGGNHTLIGPEDFNEIYANLSEEEKNSIGICLDTCHVYVSYGKNTNFIKYINQLPTKPTCIHFNDCRVEGKDIHSPPYLGLIPPKQLDNVLKYANDNSIPLILENKAAEISYIEQINNCKKKLE